MKLHPSIFSLGLLISLLCLWLRAYDDKTNPFPKDHPIYKVPRYITGQPRGLGTTRLWVMPPDPPHYGKEIQAEIARLDTLALEWDFKLAKPSFALGELIWGTLTVHNPHEIPFILSIPYLGGEYINTIELWFPWTSRGCFQHPDGAGYLHYPWPWHKDGNDLIWKPMTLAAKESYQVQLILNVGRGSTPSRWKTGYDLRVRKGSLPFHSSHGPRKRRFWLRYINVEAYLPYEKRKVPGAAYKNWRERTYPPTPSLQDLQAELERKRKRKGPLVYRGIPVILGPYHVKTVDQVTKQAALSIQVSTLLDQLRQMSIPQVALASLNALSQSWPHEDPLKDGIRMSQVRVLAKLGRKEEAAELVSQIASPDALALKERLKLPDPPQKEPEPVSNGEPEPMPPKDPPADSGRMAWIIAAIALLAGAAFFLFMRKRATR